MEDAEVHREIIGITAEWGHILSAQTLAALECALSLLRIHSPVIIIIMLNSNGLSASKFEVIVNVDVN
ncbi:hypothetical protein BM221_004904 [Beauveria bassiana]|uniref:Uncharacterized protein n=1 Tax=Beauveria bassiana TaxID=176275 RepID=A0A2N6NM29_BEABA|nr:hypothetical protein BM221_004904 [Beauveria bassiana]